MSAPGIPAARTWRTTSVGSRPHDGASRDDGWARNLKRPRCMPEGLAGAILRQIDERRMSPGTPLATEAELLKTYRVSRGSLREALLILQVHGIIERRPGPKGGIVVADLDVSTFGRMSQLFFSLGGATVGDLVHARSAIFAETARLAAANPDTAAKLRLSGMLAALEPIDQQGYVAARERFDRAVLALAGSPVLVLLARTLEDMVDDQLDETVVAPHGWRAILLRQARTAQAIADGDGDRAETEMRDLMEYLAHHSDRRHPQAFGCALEWS